jgi:hypothetical protein
MAPMRSVRESVEGPGQSPVGRSPMQPIRRSPSRRYAPGDRFELPTGSWGQPGASASQGRGQEEERRQGGGEVEICSGVHNTGLSVLCTPEQISTEKGERAERLASSFPMHLDKRRTGGSIAETFRRNPVGNQSHPVELGQQPEASLASAGATRSTKRRQPGRRPCYRAPKSSFSQ